MKLRLRLYKGTVVVDVDENCTLAELKSIVTEKFPTINEFQLSLNGKDTLENDEKRVTEHDIVSGDIIRILTAEQPQNELRAIKAVAVNENQSLQNNRPNPSEANISAEENLPNAGASSAVAENPDFLAEDEDCIQDSVVNRYLNEPMLVRDSTTEQVPQTLREAWRSAHFQSDHQAMIPILHVLMTEVGFVEKAKPDNQPVYIPSVNLTSTAAFKLVYTHNICNNSFTLMIVPVGPLLVIHGSVYGEKEEVICQLQIKSNDFISELHHEDVVKVFKDLQKLSRLFKDSIAYPLLQKARMDLGEVQENSLSGLITELKIAIMSYLDMKSLLAFSRTAHEMHNLSQEPILWRRLYLKDFGRFRNGENDLQEDWQKLYRDKHVQRARHRQAMRNMTFITPPFINRPVPIAPLPLGPVYPHGAIGGDYDRGPNFGGLPGAIGPFPGALFPLRPRPRFDPFGPDPGQNFRPGRGGGIWENDGNHLEDLGGRRQPNLGGRLGSGRAGSAFGFSPRFF